MAARLRLWAERFRDALAFLTRIIPPRSGADSAALSACVPFFAAAGLALGGLYLAAALAAFAAAGASAGPPAAALAAWVWTALDIWATRGLHWDGVADLGDATGCGATGERFWQVLRDSRLGAFGVLHLLTAFSGQWLALACHFASGHWLAPLLAPAWGRAAAVWLCGNAPPRDGHSLGGLACAGSGLKLARTQAFLGGAMLAALWLGGEATAWRLAALGLGQCLLLRRLRRLAAAHGGLSGDFLGACIQWSQIWLLLASV